MRHTQLFALLLVLFGSASLAIPIPTPGTEMYGPQIVRVSYVQGEVKLSLGIDGSPDLGKNWIAAGVNFPIEEGATLATEEGRAEVEFENGSMVYLAEHSVLQFLELSSDFQGTVTKVTLLTGRATFAVESNGHDEFTVVAAATQWHTSLTKTVRVEGALDGALFRVVEGSLQILEGKPPRVIKLGPGEAVQSIDGMMMTRAKNLREDAEQTAWDQWVKEEQTARRADIAKGLKESGLAMPIPGLVDLVRDGTFSDCAPYGKCWEPKEAPAPGNTPDMAKPVMEPALRTQNPGTQRAANSNPAQTATVRYQRTREDLGPTLSYDGPCGTGRVRRGRNYVEKTMMFTAEHPEGVVVKKHFGTEWGPAGTGGPQWWQGYDWATCYGGSWIPGGREEQFGCHAGRGGHHGNCHPPHRKRWVVGPRVRSGSFLRVKVGRHVGLIPRHPLDVPGKPPRNAKDGVLTFHKKDGQEIVQLKSAPHSLRMVNSWPGPIEEKWARSLPKVERPVIEGRLMQGAVVSASRTAAQAGNQKNQESIRFDYKLQSFVTRSAGAGGGGGSRGSSGGGGHSGGGGGGSHGGGGGSGGGGSHGGGGSSGGGGGGSHGGGGGGGSSGGGSSGGGGSSSSAGSSGGGGGGGHPH
jgi:hypothetical protein